MPPADVGFFGITVSRDGNDLYYAVKQNLDKGTLYRVPIFGGTPTNRIAFIPFAGGEPIKVFSYQGADRLPTAMQWAADGKSILYTMNRNNATNIWSQPLDGSPAKQVTDFKDGLMSAFAWSRDGKTLACTRGISLRDAVLISDTK